MKFSTTTYPSWIFQRCLRISSTTLPSLVSPLQCAFTSLQICAFFIDKIFSTTGSKEWIPALESLCKLIENTTTLKSLNIQVSGIFVFHTLCSWTNNFVGKYCGILELLPTVFQALGKNTSIENFGFYVKILFVFLIFESRFLLYFSGNFDRPKF